MKFWKRIFVYSMLLFLIIFNGAGVFIIENIHKRNLDTFIQTSLNEHNSMVGILYLNADSLQKFDIAETSYLKNWLDLIINKYVFNNNLEYNMVEVYNDNNDILFSNLKIDVPSTRVEITESKNKEKSFIIRNIDNKHYLFISSSFNLHSNVLKLLVAKDIEFIYVERIENYKLFLYLDTLVLVVLAVGMYLISKNITRPIVELSVVSKEVASGNYQKRVKINKKNDELSSLAKNFNIMIEATENTIQELKNLNHSKQRFIDSLTHELKTPLTSIIGYSDLLLKGNIDDEIKYKSLSYINSEAKRLENLSVTLLKLILVKNEEMTFTSVSLKDCVATACKTLNYKLEEKNISLNLSINHCCIIGDMQLIIVLIINLLDNAIKACNENCAIEIKSKYSNSGQLILTIKDNGIGIPKEDLSRIKQPFYSVSKGKEIYNTGMGLGLSICEEICKIHNINFTINSEINEGTLVTLVFSQEAYL